jgi:hypothetical protein
MGRGGHCRYCHLKTVNFIGVGFGVWGLGFGVWGVFTFYPIPGTTYLVPSNKIDMRRKNIYLENTPQGKKSLGD